MRLKRLAVVAASLCAIVAVLAAPVQAAETPTSDAYSGVAGQVGSGSEPTGTESSPSAVADNVGSEQVSESTTSGVLPFTGMQLAIIAAVGLALFGVGLALRRTARPGRLG